MTATTGFEELDLKSGDYILPDDRKASIGLRIRRAIPFLSKGL
ncbi:hypothetical protein ACK3SF_02960 [Candidatus Nanosalina sp. VS9-1]